MRKNYISNFSFCPIFPSSIACKSSLIHFSKIFLTIQRFDSDISFLFPAYNIIFIMTPTYQEAHYEKSVEPCLPSLENSLVDSEYHPNYIEFMGKIYDKERQRDITFPSYMERFAQYGIEYSPSNEFVQKLRLIVHKESINSEVMAFWAYWGKFRIKLTILHSEMSSCSHRQQKHEGSFGKVYLTSMLGFRFALKCIPFQFFKNSRTAKIMAIKQFLLLKLAAALKIGPQIENYFGFDIIMYKNCAQFAMQTCKKIQNPSEQLMSSFKESLYTMHRFGFVHIDIKPENLMMSEHFKKPVFIDFGLSEIINAELGKKIPFNYRGTLLYCGEQMIKSFETQSVIQMDLYYNDCESLRKSMVAMQQKEEFSGMFFEENDNENQQISATENHCLNYTQIIAIPLKYCLFSDNISSLFSIVQSNPQIATRNLYNILLLFLKELPITHNLEWFYESVDPFYREGLELIDVNEAYTSTTNKFHNFSINEERKTCFLSEYAEIEGQMEQLEMNFFRKNQLEAFLMNFQSIQTVKKEVYFKRFMDYVNFSNNVHSVTMEQRTTVSLICLKILKPNLEVDNPELNEQRIHQKKQGLLLVKEVIELLLASLLQSYKADKNLDKIQQKQKKDLRFLLLQHHFILRIGTAQSLRNLLEKMYAITAATYQQRFQMLLKVKDYNAWFYYRVQTQQIDSDSYELIVQSWRTQKWLDPSRKIEQPEQIKPHLATLAQIDIILTKMSIGTFNQPANYRLLLPVLQVHKIGIYRFYFQLFEIQHNKNENIERCREICRFVEKNIACEEIMAEMRFVQKMNWIGMKDEELIEELCEFFDNAQSSRVLMKEAMAIDQALEKIILVNRLRYNQASKKSNLPNLIAKLQKIVPVITLNTYFSLTDTHHCISTVLINNLVNIRLSYQRLTCSPAPYDNIIIQIERTIDSISCGQCKEAIKLTTLFLRQNYILRFIYNKKLEIQFINNFKNVEEIIMKSNFKEKLVSESLMNRFLLSRYCLFHPHLQKKYQAALVLYRGIREQNIFIQYVANQLNVDKILEVALMRVFEKYGIGQFAWFLDRMSQCIGVNYSYRSFKILERCFQEVINKIGGKFQYNVLFQALFAIEKKRQQRGSVKRNHFNIVYYNAIFVHCQEHRMINKLKTKFCKYLPFLPKLISHIYETNLYRFVIFELTMRNAISEESRRIISLKRRIMKIYTMQQINSGLIFKKNNKNYQFAFQILQRKALTLGGPVSSTAEKEYQYVKIKKAPF